MSFRRAAVLLLASLAGCGAGDSSDPPDAVQRIALEVDWSAGSSVPRLVTIDADGANYVVLEEVPAGFAAGPVPASDGSILFQTYVSGTGGWHLWHGAAPSFDFPVPDRVWSPVWSPNGRSIAWMHDVLATSTVGVAPRGGTDIKDLTPGDFIMEQFPSWSPDNRRLAAKRRTELGWDIYVASVSGDVQPLVVGDGPVFEPDWSLAVDKIAYVRPYAAAPASGIYIIDPDGSNKRQLVSGSYDGGVYWSPDGRTIAFWGYRNGSPVPDMVLVDVASGEVSAPLPLPQYAYPAHRPWSPDGSLLLVYSQGFGMERPGVVYTIDRSGTVHQVTADSVSANFPAWLP